jgi:NADH-quinone oxidoreductase subunit L
VSSSAENIKWVLAGIAVVGAIVGIAGAYLVYEKKRVKAVEPAILANAWNYDKGVSAFMGGPGRKAFDDLAWVDKNIIDGAVNGTAVGVRSLGGLLRKTQTGFVRNYALGIGVGVVALLGWFLIRGVI